MVGMKLSKIHMSILHTAVVCRTAGAARYLHEPEVEQLIAAGYLSIRNEFSATITDKGLAAFVKGNR